MRRSRGMASRPFLLFALFFCLVLLVGQVGAQRQNPNPDPEPTTNDDDLPTETEAVPTETEAATTETEAATKTDAPTTNDLPAITTETPTAPTVPTLDPSKSANVPSLPPLFKIPVASVPPTAGAPYLRKSNVPEGTIFIAVGAALGAFGLGVVAWRGLVAWSINRSVRRAATGQNQSDATALLSKKRKSGIYKQSAGPAMSMEKMGNPSRHSRISQRGHTPNSSLFFSPTAGAGMHAPGNRGSGYLPAGYYAAGTSNVGNGPGLAHATQSIGLSPLGPQAQGYSRTRSTGPSPPGSPSLPPASRGHELGYPSTSSLNLSNPPQGRAPSAYLEDLFENHHPPGR
ncbi:hypothetical protein FQN55_008655 [Onygenales sp. PD_40]|nr:hypothetical protein FQN55_008655 [Onygenales sp. PD_40]